MLSVTLQAEIGSNFRQPDCKPDPPKGFIAALYSGGDRRMAFDPYTGLNKYLCPKLPTPELIGAER
jgi:hypothetical protein